MQTIYIYTTFGFLISDSYKKGTNADAKDRLPESEQKAALALLGFTIAKFFLSYIFSKILPKLPKAVQLYVTGAVCAITLFVHTLIASLSRDKYSAAWFFAALFWGIQDAILQGRIETGTLNPFTEVSEDLLDSTVLVRVLGMVLIGFVGVATRHSRPIWLMLPLMLVFVASFGLTFWSFRKKSDSAVKEKLLIDAGDSSEKDKEKDKEIKEGKRFS